MCTRLGDGMRGGRMGAAAYLGIKRNHHPVQAWDGQFVEKRVELFCVQVAVLV